MFYVAFLITVLLGMAKITGLITVSWGTVLLPMILWAVIIVLVDQWGR